MTEEPASPSQRDEARALAKEGRTKGFERRGAVFDLFVSGFSHQQIAKALEVSTATVRRIIDTAVAERRLDAPERFARVRALSHADFKLAQGDIRAFAAYLKIVDALDRYHGLTARGLPFRPAELEAVLSAPPPLALPPASPTDPDSAEVADFGFRRLTR